MATNKKASRECKYAASKVGSRSHVNKGKKRKAKPSFEISNLAGYLGSSSCKKTKKRK